MNTPLADTLGIPSPFPALFGVSVALCEGILDQVVLKKRAVGLWFDDGEVGLLDSETMIPVTVNGQVLCFGLMERDGVTKLPMGRIIDHYCYAPSAVAAAIQRYNLPCYFGGN